MNAAPTGKGRTAVPPHLVVLALDRCKAHIEKRIRFHGDGAFVGPHEVMGFLEEEVREAWDATRANQPHDLAAELLDVALVALFGCASLWATGRVALPEGGGALTIMADDAGAAP